MFQCGHHCVNFKKTKIVEIRLRADLKRFVILLFLNGGFKFSILEIEIFVFIKIIKT